MAEATETLRQYFGGSKTKILFLFVTGFYFLTELWQQVAESERQGNAFNFFHILLSSFAGVVALTDLYINRNSKSPASADEEIDAVLVAVFTILLFSSEILEWINNRKMPDNYDDRNITFHEALLVLVSYAAVFVLITIIVASLW